METAQFFFHKNQTTLANSSERVLFIRLNNPLNLKPQWNIYLGFYVEFIETADVRIGVLRREIRFLSFTNKEESAKRVKMCL